MNTEPSLSVADCHLVMTIIGGLQSLWTNPQLYAYQSRVVLQKKLSTYIHFYNGQAIEIINEAQKNPHSNNMKKHVSEACGKENYTKYVNYQHRVAVQYHLGEDDWSV